MKVVLPSTSPFTAKDQRKSDRATCFIGRGSSRSSTNTYASVWGDRANKGVYAQADIVFVSVEGARGGRMPLDAAEVMRAVKAGASFVADSAADRERPYNTGERELAALLRAQGYSESAGFWRPSKTVASTTNTSGAMEVFEFDSQIPSDFRRAAALAKEHGGIVRHQQGAKL